MNLPSYATKEEYSRGRRYPEKGHPYRSLYQRDRDRIIHSAAFRRLEYKTQVFLFREGDYYRTRLTHTLEVSQIARTIAKALHLNENLSEAIALAHDIGHTPFGHAGESALNELLKEEGGFNHNLQGLRTVDLLEKRYPEFEGLNLSWEVREGIAKHSTRYDNPPSLEDFPDLAVKEQPTLETQAVDIADEIAYDNHDLDDGLKFGLIKIENLRTIELWRIIEKEVRKKYSNLNEELERFLMIRSFINKQVTDLIKNTRLSLKKNGIKTWEDVKNHPTRLVSFSPEMNLLRKPMREFLYNNLYCHWRVLRMTEKAKRIVKSIFEVYLQNPQQLPPSVIEKRTEESLKRKIADYIAGMTDRFAMEEYKKMFDPYERI